MNIALFDSPSDIVFDGVDSFYVTDSGNHVVRKINTTTNLVSTVAGKGSPGLKDGDATDSYLSNPVAISKISATKYVISDASNYRLRVLNLAEEPSITEKVIDIVGRGTAGKEVGGVHVAQLDRPTDMVRDSKGNLFIVASDIHQIRKLDKNGDLTIFAGSTRGYTDAVGENAQFRNPVGITIDDSDNLFVTDTGNQRIRQITPDGTVSTIAGSGLRGYLDGAAADAKFNYPQGIAINSAGELFVADRSNHRIRKIVGSTVSTLTGSRRGDSEGDMNYAYFNEPFYLAFDSSNNLYVSDRANHKIRKVSASGEVTTLAGFKNGYRDAKSKKALFSYPLGLAVKGNSLYIADNGNNRIRRLDLSTGLVNTFAGAGFRGYWDKGKALSFNNLYALRIDTDGNLLIADGDNNKVRKILLDSYSGSSETLNFNSDSKYYVSTLAGNGARSSNDAPVNFASFFSPYGIVSDSAGNIYVGDRDNHRIRVISKDGEVSTFAGSGKGFVDDVSLKAKFNRPSGMAFDASGNLYVADRDNHRIRMIDTSGNVSSYAGVGKAGSNNGNKSEARFRQPSDLAFDSEGNLYVADTGNHKIRKIDVDGTVTTYAGYHQSGYFDAKAIYARFRSPYSIDFDKDDNLYIADYGNHRISKVSSDGYVTTFAGSGAASFKDGAALDAQFNNPIDIEVSNSGVVFVSDGKNHRIRKIERGRVSSIAGYGIAAFADGRSDKAAFNNPRGILIGPSNELYVADASNNRIRIISSLKSFAEDVLGLNVTEQQDDNSRQPVNTDSDNTRPVVRIVTDLAARSSDTEKYVFKKGTDLEVRAFVFDLEDRSSIESGMTWSSNIQGQFDLGKSFNIKKLDEGSHRVTIKVIDSGNLVAVDGFNIDIVSKLDDGDSSGGGDDGEVTDVESTTFIKIIAPENKIYRSNKKYNFIGLAIDTASANSDLSSQIIWSSDKDGELGRGERLKKIKLSKGVHNLTATVGNHTESLSVEVLAPKKARKNTKRKGKKKKGLKAKPKTIKEAAVEHDDELPEIKTEQESTDEVDDDFERVESREVFIRMKLASSLL